MKTERENSIKTADFWPDLDGTFLAVLYKSGQYRDRNYLSGSKRRFNEAALTAEISPLPVVGNKWQQIVIASDGQ